jgi:hypothetical protein
MEDRELLERAAEAAGMDGQWCEFHGMDVGQDAYGIGDPCVHRWGDKLWNPLTDDGDALRLAVKLNILWSADFMHFLSLERFSNQAHDDTVAYRRAITRAAASLAPKE